MGEITHMLRLVAAGDALASRRLFELVYEPLKRMAYGRVGARGCMELDATALVHETFVRLQDQLALELTDRAAFFGYVGRVMRSIVVDHVRAREALKRGGNVQAVTLTTGVAGCVFEDERLLALNAALDTMERIAPEYRSLLDMRYFAGLSVREIAELRGASTRTIEREWQKACAFLRGLMEERTSAPP
jgi:RNA polymerase sigma factor (TIGR02999 family)